MRNSAEFSYTKAPKRAYYNVNYCLHRVGVVETTSSRIDQRRHQATLFFIIRILFLVLLGSLKVVYRLDAADDLGGGTYILYDLVDALICHRRLVKSVGNNAGGVNT